MWGPIWPGVEPESRPVRAITNGVHVPTWLSSDMKALFDTHLQSGWLERHDDPAVWQAVLDIPDEELWRVAHVASQLPVRVHSRARAAALEGRARHRGTGGRRRDAARSKCTDHRLREALHRLQAPRTDLPRRGPPDRDPHRRPAARADRLRRESPPGRRDRQAPPAAGLPPRDRSEVRRTHRFRRRLRPARRALPGAGLRRVDEQSAQAARGLGHERYEGLDQRRSAPQHRRRLVGGRLLGSERMAHRRPDGLERPRGRRRR